MDERASREVAVGDGVDGRYELKRSIARGGAGSVFEAEHLVTGQRLAVKVLNRDLRNHSEARARLLREARALTLARHRNVVTACDAGVDPQWGPFVVMELLEGRALAGVLAARRQLEPRDAVRVALEVCDALEASHACGILHRDVKPHNVFITIDESETELAKLLDFGVAALRGERQVATDPKLTAHGAVLGTPEYMAPEQLRGDESIDVRCDVYGLGVMLFECLTGEVPFEGSFAQVIRQVWTMAMPTVRERRPELPEELSRVVDRALARDPAERYGRPNALADALRQAVPISHPTGSLLGIFPRGPVTLARQTDVTRPVDDPRADAAATPEPSSTQRRRHTRVPYVTPVTVARGKGTTIFGRSEDISEGGMLVVTGQPCEGPEVVTIRFVLPGTGRFAELRATARWTSQAREVGAVGFEFLAPPEDALRTIREHVGRIASLDPNGRPRRA